MTVVSINTYDEIIQYIQSINPIKYTQSRNFLDGNVTKLSPYITHGFIGLPTIRDHILECFSLKESEKLLQELAWREFFRRVWESKSDEIFSDLRFDQECTYTQVVPTAISNGTTGINVLDSEIYTLTQQGYIHNHSRMWIASTTCNIGNYHWLAPSKWMYYHLLDGDLASNSLSWQWVAGSFSSKKYYVNQENINKYAKDNQKNTFLDTTYEQLEVMNTPHELQEHETLQLHTKLPASTIDTHQLQGSIQLYSPFTLDPKWNVNTEKKVLLFEPSHFEKFPISPKRIEHILSLASSIGNVDILVEESGNLPKNCTYHAMRHPLTSHWNAAFSETEYLFPEVNGYFKNFFSYWKECQKFLEL